MPEDAVAFTDYVRELGSGDEPSPAVFEAAWNKLRRVLISELRKRALWSAPPSYLGIYGHGRWSESEALEELLLDCFEAVFVHRLKALEALLTDEGREIDPLCVRNVRYFLHERQRKHDALGFRVFGVVRAAIRRLIASATLDVLDGDPRVRNSTLLGFSSCTEPDGAAGIDLTEHVGGWLDDLLPELVTAQPARLPEVEERLCRDELTPTRERLTRTEPILLSVLLPRRFFADGGEYRVRLSELEGGRASEIEWKCTPRHRRQAQKVSP